MNVVTLASGGFVEIQGTAEQEPFSDQELTAMLQLARQGTSRLIQMQIAARAD